MRVVEDLQTMIFFINGLAEKPPPVAESNLQELSPKDIENGFESWFLDKVESSGVQRSWKLGQHGFFLMYILYIVYTHECNNWWYSISSSPTEDDMYRHMPDVLFLA